MMNGFIEFQNIHKSFGARSVLNGVSLSVEKGETMVIMGASGSGKTVMLRHIIGLLKPDDGRIVIDGTDITLFSEEELIPVRRKIGTLFQGGALFDSMTVTENVAFGLREHTTLSDEEIKDKVDDKLELIGLSGIGHMLPAELSGGMKKRVALARSIAVEPEGILYDEPTTGLDPVTGHMISTLIKEMGEKLQVTSVVVTHDVDSTFFIADRIAFLHEGRLIFVGTADEARISKDPHLRDFLSAYGGRYVRE
jgi:phospholipid/cholesterol/gamma-HCH transport system ATP-binding protein